MEVADGRAALTKMTVRRFFYASLVAKASARGAVFSDFLLCMHFGQTTSPRSMIFAKWGPCADGASSSLASCVTLACRRYHSWYVLLASRACFLALLTLAGAVDARARRTSSRSFSCLGEDTEQSRLPTAIREQRRHRYCLCASLHARTYCHRPAGAAVTCENRVLAALRKSSREQCFCGSEKARRQSLRRTWSFMSDKHVRCMAAAPGHMVISSLFAARSARRCFACERIRATAGRSS